MKINRAALSAVLAIAAIIYAPACVQATTGSVNGITVQSTDKIYYDDLNNKFAIKGNAYICNTDSATGRTFEAYAESITAALFSSKSRASGLDSVKSAKFAGPVKIIYITKSQGTSVKTIATADNATYDGTEKIAYLTGHVKITNENPSLFDAPSVMTGDKATVNLNRTIGQDDFRFKVESTDGGVSRIEATPKPKEQSKK